MSELRCMCGDSQCPSCGSAQGTLEPRKTRKCRRATRRFLEVHQGHIWRGLNTRGDYWCPGYQGWAAQGGLDVLSGL